MRQRPVKQSHAHTLFVHLDTKKCEACWKCLDVCSNKVIGRIDLPWHKHARFTNGTACSGCMKCMKVCTAGAITKLATV